ncbi:MAG: PorT family protein [Bacteroidales bacterium]|nr:PorT family protein [Bacteroidales bacterium]
MLLFNKQASAQKRKVYNMPSYDEQLFHPGFFLGINQMLFSVKTVDSLPFIKWEQEQSPDIFADSLFVQSVTSTPTPGFTIGIVANLRVAKNLDFRFVPSLSFGERLLNYNILSYDEGNTQVIETQKSITSTTVDFPFLFKYKSKRLNNMRMYVLAGAKYSLDLASQKKAQKNSSDITVKIKKHDIALEAGAGVDFYADLFKFGIELKMGYGFFNMIKQEGNLYTDSIERLNSKVFMLSFTFE